MKENMSEVGKYGEWYERMCRTVLSRGRVFSDYEMGYWGIVEVINDSCLLDDGVDQGEHMQRIMRQGMGRQLVASNTMDITGVDDLNRAVLVESAVRYGGSGMGMRIYSGIVFRNQYFMNWFVLNHPEDYPEVNILSRLVN